MITDFCLQNDQNASNFSSGDVIRLSTNEDPVFRSSAL